MWKTLLDLVFPRSCVGCKKIGNYICDLCFSYIRFATTPQCPVCYKHSIEGATHPRCKRPYSIDGLISAVDYAGVIKRLLYQFKYKPYVSDLRDQIGRLMCESLEENEMFHVLLKKEALWTPVPLHSGRLKKRGYNHALLLCSYVAQYFMKDFQKDIVFRVKNTSPQYRLSKTARFSNVKNAFSINPKYLQNIKGKTIVVVDDVATTCSTLREIAKILKRNGAKEVWGVVFAREQFSE